MNVRQLVLRHEIETLVKLPMSRDRDEALKWKWIGMAYGELIDDRGPQESCYFCEKIKDRAECLVFDDFPAVCWDCHQEHGNRDANGDLYVQDERQAPPIIAVDDW